MAIRVNLAGVESEFEALPSGRYLCNITDGEIRESGPEAKHPGSEYIRWELTVAQGDFEGRKLFTNSTLLEHALFSLHNVLKATGKWDQKALDNPKFEFEIDEVVGSQVVAVVAQRDYQGEMVNDVKRLKPVSADALADSSVLP